MRGATYASARGERAGREGQVSGPLRPCRVCCGRTCGAPSRAARAAARWPRCRAAVPGAMRASQCCCRIDETHLDDRAEAPRGASSRSSATERTTATHLVRVPALELAHVDPHDLEHVAVLVLGRGARCAEAAARSRGVAEERRELELLRGRRRGRVGGRCESRWGRGGGRAGRGRGGECCGGGGGLEVVRDGPARRDDGVSSSTTLSTERRSDDSHRRRAGRAKELTHLPGSNTSNHTSSSSCSSCLPSPSPPTPPLRFALPDPSSTPTTVRLCPRCCRYSGSRAVRRTGPPAAAADWSAVKAFSVQGGGGEALVEDEEEGARRK